VAKIRAPSGSCIPVLMPSRIFRPLAPSLQGRLSLLLVAVLCLGATLAGWLIWQGYRNERHAMERHLADTARALATLMEGELSAREALLKGLAVSPDLNAGNLAAFYAQARQAVTGPNEWIVLADAVNRQLINTVADQTTPLPPVSLNAELQAAMNEGRTYLSNLEAGVLSQKDVLFVAIPVRTAENTWQALCLVITPEVFTRAILNHQIGDGWLISIVDRDMRIAGRSRSPDKYLGQRAGARLIELSAGRSSGVIETVTLDGVPSITAFSRSSRSGWTVIVAAPHAELFAGGQRLAAQALGVAVGAGALAIFFALWVGRSVIAGVHALVWSTEKIAAGEKITAVDTGIDEIDSVSKALASTSETLASRESALARARDEALAASRAKDEFLAALSHELRTPLNPVLLLASDGAKDPAHPPAVREAFNTIVRNVSIEARLIDDLLDLTRISSGKLSLHLQALPIDRVLHETIETLRRQIDEKSLALTVDLKTNGAIVTGDFTRLQQVFWNLLNNAIKFTPPHKSLRIVSCVGDSGDEVQISVSDSGIGMSPGEIARLFRRFTQGDHASNGRQSEYGGLGLGLVIARTLVEMHQGRIEAGSAGKGQGSTFTVRLPLGTRSLQSSSGNARGESIRKTDATASHRDEPPGIPPRKILLVEDHGPTLATLEKLLRRRGHEIASARTTRVALQHAAAEAFDLVISDIGLPDHSGYELMRELRDRYGLRGIAMSGYGAEADRIKSKEAGFSIHLTKPVNIASLEDALRKLIAGPQA
jgi:signal transduction histidine kinase